MKNMGRCDFAVYSCGHIESWNVHAKGVMFLNPALFLIVAMPYSWAFTIPIFQKRNLMFDGEIHESGFA